MVSMDMQHHIAEAIGRARPVDIAGLEFRLLDSTDHLATSRKRVTTHRHPWYSLILTTRGSSLHTFPECELAIKTNELLFIPPGVRHSWRSVVVPLQFRGFIFEIHSNRFLEEQIAPLLTDAARDASYRYSLSDAELMNISDAIFESGRAKSPLLTETILSLVNQFLISSLKNSIGPILETLRMDWQTSDYSHDQRLVQRVTTHIVANLDHPLTREDVADHVYYSVRHLNRIFRHETGESLGVFIRRARTERVKALLSSPELAIKEIAHAVGYHEQSSFYRMARRELGMTPAEYRRRHHGEAQDSSERAD